MKRKDIVLVSLLFTYIYYLYCSLFISIFVCTLHIQDVDSELVWQQLTDTEKEEFHKMLGDGRIGHLLDTYTPWWKVRSSLSACAHILIHIHTRVVHFVLYI